MGLLLDLAVGIIAVAVTVSLGMLAWTLGVSAVLATRRGRAQVVDRRAALRSAEERMLSAAARTRETLGHVAERTRRNA